MNLLDDWAITKKSLRPCKAFLLLFRSNGFVSADVRMFSYCLSSSALCWDIRNVYAFDWDIEAEGERNCTSHQSKKKIKRIRKCCCAEYFTNTNSRTIRLKIEALLYCGSPIPWMKAMKTKSFWIIFPVIILTCLLPTKRHYNAFIFFCTLF